MPGRQDVSHPLWGWIAGWHIRITAALPSSATQQQAATLLGDKDFHLRFAASASLEMHFWLSQIGMLQPIATPAHRMSSMKKSVPSRAGFGTSVWNKARPLKRAAPERFRSLVRIQRESRTYSSVDPMCPWWPIHKLDSMARIA